MKNYKCSQHVTTPRGKKKVRNFSLFFPMGKLKEAFIPLLPKWNPPHLLN